MFEQLSRFITDNYQGAKKIVEVGVGQRIDFALEVKKRLPMTDVVVTDKDESWIRYRGISRVRAVVDDVMFPNLSIYEGATLIYSLHPPIELVPALVGLAQKVNADLLVLPVADEQEAFEKPTWNKITREGRTVGWLASSHFSG